MSIKKIIFSIIAVAMLGSLSITSTFVNATSYNDDVETIEYMGKIIAPVISNTDRVLFVVQNEGEYSGNYYMDSESDLPKKVSNDFDTSNIDKTFIIDMSDENNKFNHWFYVKYDSWKGVMQYGSMGDWGCPESVPSNLIIGESENTSITEFTVGESTYPRGDINLDGNVNTVDLLMLKKYLLGLMEW